MAFKLQVIDVNHKEFIHTVESALNIRIDKTCSGRFNVDFEEYQAENIKPNTTLSAKTRIWELIEEFDLDLEDCGFDLDDYADDFFYNKSVDELLEDCDEDEIEEVAKYLRRKGYLVEKIKTNED